MTVDFHSIVMYNKRAKEKVAGIHKSPYNSRSFEQQHVRPWTEQLQNRNRNREEINLVQSTLSQSQTRPDSSLKFRPGQQVSRIVPCQESLWDQTSDLKSKTKGFTPTELPVDIDRIGISDNFGSILLSQLPDTASDSCCYNKSSFLMRFTETWGKSRPEGRR